MDNGNKSRTARGKILSGEKGLTKMELHTTFRRDYLIKETAAARESLFINLVKKIKKGRVKRGEKGDQTTRIENVSMEKR